MMLSVSMQQQGKDIKLTGIMDGTEAVDAAIPHGDLITAFGEAVLLGSDDELAKARTALLEAIGGDAFVDTCGVIGHFERMTRIADATGIPLDEDTAPGSATIREELGINDFTMASQTPGVKD